MITSFKTEQLGIGFDFDIELEKDKQIYCFIGKNGIGKTQLLENMAKSLIFSHYLLSDSFYEPLPKRDFIKLPINEWTIEENNCINKFGLSRDIRELLSLYLKNSQHVIINNADLFINFIRDFNINKIKNETIMICNKPIIFIGAKNRGFTKNIDTNNIKIISDYKTRFLDIFTRTLKYINGVGLEQEEIADWFASRLVINPAFIPTGQNKIPEAITVLKLIERLDPEIKLVTKNEDGSDKLAISSSEGKLLINNIPLDKLSTGYVSIIKIFQEIVAGYSGWTNAENLNEVEGIVFIDEIEPHLHISWQTKIIGILREFFPKTTFFISTHSPLVLAGLKSGEGYELFKEGDFVKTRKIENIENYFLNDIVKEFFDVDLNKERKAHFDTDKKKKAKEAFARLTRSLQEDE